MKVKKLIVALSLVTILSSGAASANDNLLGTLVGAAGGAAVGSNIGKGKGKIAAIAVGTLLGAGIGASIQGNNNAYASTYPVAYNNDRRWHNNHRHYRPYYSNYYQQPYYQTRVIQVNNYQPPEEEYCREFYQNVNIGGRIQQSYGTACLQPDGSWKIRK